MKKYVAGLMYNKSFKEVAIIEKNRPAKQKDKYNAIGGVVKENETLLEAMIREFQEETGCYHETWNEVCLLKGEYKIESTEDYGWDTYEVYFYYSTIDNWNHLETKTDEEIKIIEFNDADFHWMDFVPPLKTIFKLVEERNSIKLGFEKLILEAKDS